MKQKLTRLDIKVALKDSRFREILPEDLNDEVNKFLNNPGCPCNNPLYEKIAKHCKLQLQEFYPNKEIVDFEEELTKNNWSVINCSINELEGILRKLPRGRKQIEMARFEDQITVIVNELDFI